MQNDDIDHIEKTISEYTEVFLDAMLTGIHPFSLVHELYERICSSELKLKLESIEAAEANLMSNENATDYAKRLLSKWII